MKPKYKVVYGLGLIVLVLDQLTKWWAVSNVPRWISVPVIDGFFNLVNIRNRGAAFGFLNDPSIQWQLWIFLAATITALIVIHYMISTSKYDALLFSGLGLISGGAVGNAVDRLRFREVIDFLDFYIGQYHWPAFNVADIGICVGAFFVAVSMYRQK